MDTWKLVLSMVNRNSSGTMSKVITSAEREKAFREAILKVCAEHGAEIEITDDGKPYGMHKAILMISMPSVWDGDRLVKDFCEFSW